MIPSTSSTSSQPPPPVADSKHETPRIFSCSFLGRFTSASNVVFGSPSGLISVDVDGDLITLIGVPAVTELHFPHSLYHAVARIGGQLAPDSRYLNVAQFMSRSKELEKFDSQYPEMIMYFALRAFIVTGITTAVENLRYLPDCEAVLIEHYLVPCPEDWEQRISRAQVTFTPDCMKFASSFVRSHRMAPYRVSTFTPYLPDCSDKGTVLAGMCRRLFPRLPARTTRMEEKMTAVVSDLIRLVEADVYTIDDAQCLEEFLSRRSDSEKQRLLLGVNMWNHDPDEAIRFYLDAKQQYKCFFKGEAYPQGSKKPPRFIMCVDYACRGIQYAALHRVLKRIEHATTICNVKHLRPDEIRQKLERKFSNVPLCCETDFTSFESCQTPELKALIENRVFMELGEASTKAFLQHAVVARPTLPVNGPWFRIGAMPHIRMTGDYWTSIGNMLTNLVITTASSEESLSWIMNNSVFEGDDAVFPVPKVGVDRYQSNAADCGVLLKLDVDSWVRLSFCGNHFEDINGRMQQFRDGDRAIMGLSVLYQADRNSNRQDMMLQRSKCLSVLSGPWIPNASAFAACVERLTRHIKVSENYLVSHGLLRGDYTSHALEGCLPEDLRECTLSMFPNVVAKHESLVGGSISPKSVLLMLESLREHGFCEMPWVGNSEQIQTISAAGRSPSGGQRIDTGFVERRSYPTVRKSAFNHSSLSYDRLLIHPIVWVWTGALILTIIASLIAVMDDRAVLCLPFSLCFATFFVCSWLLRKMKPCRNRVWWNPLTRPVLQHHVSFV